MTPSLFVTPTYNKRLGFMVVRGAAGEGWGEGWDAAACLCPPEGALEGGASPSPTRSRFATSGTSYVVPTRRFFAAR